jgi:hypothetical protein
MDNGVPGRPPASYEVARNKLLSRISEVEYIAETLRDDDAYRNLLNAAGDARDQAYYSSNAQEQHYTRWGDHLGRALEGLTELNQESANALTSVLNEIKQEASQINPPPRE